jgi:phage tail-like protein
MAKAQLTTPFLGFCFVVSIPNFATAAFSEATVSEIAIGTTSYREGSDPPYMRSFSGLATYSNPILRKCLSDSVDLYNWISLMVSKGPSVKNASRNITLSLMGGANDILASWNLVNATPVRYTTSGMNAASADVIIETLEFSVDRMERTK